MAIIFTPEQMFFFTTARYLEILEGRLKLHPHNRIFIGNYKPGASDQPCMLRRDTLMILEVFSSEKIVNHFIMIWRINESFVST